MPSPLRREAGIRACDKVCRGVPKLRRNLRINRSLGAPNRCVESAESVNGASLAASHLLGSLHVQARNRFTLRVILAIHREARKPPGTDGTFSMPPVMLFNQLVQLRPDQDVGKHPILGSLDEQEAIFDIARGVGVRGVHAQLDQLFTPETGERSHGHKPRLHLAVLGVAVHSAEHFAQLVNARRHRQSRPAGRLSRLERRKVRFEEWQALRDQPAIHCPLPRRSQ